VETIEVAWVTGEGSPNSTGSRAAVHATDLGILWDAGDSGVLVAFGDSYGAGWCGHGAGPRHADWRCNVLARTPLTEPSEGLVLDSWVEDAPGHAAQVLPRDPDAREETVIPTAGIAVGGRQYLHAMSVRRWHGPGRWTTNYSALWSSTDGGRRWERTGVQWRNGPRRWWQRWRPDGSRFQMGALARDGEHVLLFGTPHGRFGAAHLARAPETDLHAWEYFDGGSWVPDPGAARPVMPAPVAELSVLFHRPSARWLAMTLDEHRAAIVLRSAPSPTGPWSDGEPVVTGRQYPGLYGGHLHPCSADGDLYFTMSQWGPYNVRLMRTRLSYR
jgi:hypothetical protein